MSALQVVELILIIIHFLGMAAIVGPFFFQLRRKTGFDFRVMLIGAITQVVTGLALVGVAYGIGEEEVNNAKIGVKFTVALVVLAATIIATMRQKKAVAAGTSDRVALPWLHIAGAGAVANVIIALVWQ